MFMSEFVCKHCAHLAYAKEFFSSYTSCMESPVRFAARDMTVQQFAQPKDYKALRNGIKAFAADPRFNLDDRLAIYQHMHLLFDVVSEHLVRQDHSFKPKKYEIKDSLLSEAEFDTLLLKESHKALTNERLASEVFYCSVNTISARRNGFADGVHIGAMSVQNQKEYGGAFVSSVHPVSLPLHLSEVYVLLRALKEYEARNSSRGYHASEARKLANMVYGQLSDYGKQGLEDRIREAGWELEDEPALYSDANFNNRDLLILEKSGSLVRVKCTDGQEALGVIDPWKRPEDLDWWAQPGEEGDSGSADQSVGLRHDPRSPFHVLRLKDGTYKVFAEGDLLEVVDMDYRGR